MLTTTQTIKYLIKHNWQYLARSPLFKRKLVFKILYILVTFMMILNFLFLGYFLDELVKKAFEGQNVPEMVNRHVLFFLFILFVIRFFMQKLPKAQAIAYLILPVSKRRFSLCYFLLFLLHFFNFIPVILVIPYWIKVILNNYTLEASIIWLCGIFLVSAAFSFLVLIMKMISFNRPVPFFIGAGVILLLFLSDFFQFVSIVNPISEMLFNGLLSASYAILILSISLFVGIFYLAFYFFKQNLYIDNLTK